MHIKLLQWNVWIKEKPENIIKTLQKIDADILCLQELTTNSLFNPGKNIPEIISKPLNLNSFFAPANDWNLPENIRIQGNGILSKFPFVKKNFIYLQQPETNIQDFSKEGRVYVEIAIQIGEKTLTVGTTHLSYTHRFIMTEQKQQEVKKLTEVFETKKTHYLFTADLNARPFSSCVKSIQKYLKHLGPDFSEKTWTTKPFDYLGFQEEKLNWRLDYIFGTKDIDVISTQVIKTNYSDHLPILLTIDI